MVQRRALQEPRRSGRLRAERVAEVYRIRIPEPRGRTTAPRLAPESLRLLEALLDTVEKVDLAWHVSRAARSLLASELQAEAHLDAAAMRPALAELVGARVVELSGGPAPRVRLAARARRADFEALMRLYADDRPAVLAALASLALARIRTMTAHRFIAALALTTKKGQPR